MFSSLFGRLSQQSRLLRLTTPAGPEVLLAESVRGLEGIDESFRFEISALSADAHIKLRALIGQPALLELLTASWQTARRPFHGHITGIEQVGANGGLARYRLVLEPWTAFLAYTRDSTTYQDMTAPEILEAVFADYEGQGRLAPAWRFDLRDPSVYARRSLTTQYQESDLAFVRRLMVEEGLFFWFEHKGDVASSSLGSHTLVIADHNGALTINAQPEVRFTQPGAVMREDSLDRWRAERRWQSNGVVLQSWDYRTAHRRQVQAMGGAHNASDTTPLILRDIPGQYMWETAENGQRMADMRMQAIEAVDKVFTGAGTVRSFAPGTTFTLREHPVHDGEPDDDARTFAILRVHHLMHNNLSADLQADVAECLGRDELSEDPEWGRAGEGKNESASPGERPLYRNRIDAIRAAVPYRPPQRDAAGRLLHPKPTVTGQQTAIVVGPPGAVIHTDRDHRIKVQFHWQRGERSHSRLAHPHPAGHTGAPADGRSGSWVRVAAALAPTAGANWGGHGIPRIDQEVLIDFLEGDIDRPVVVATVYNGRGKSDAQHNEVTQGSGASTGNAPAWFAGRSGGHAHGNALAGIKSQALAASQNGTGAYGQLVLDDSRDEARLALQHHAQAHQGTAELNLGHLRHQTDNQRLDTIGLGAELKTHHSGAIRAGQGMLLTSDARLDATGHQLDALEAQAQLSQSHALQQTLADLAQRHNAKFPGDAEAADLPPVAQLAHSLDILEGTESGLGTPEKGGHGTVPAWREPQLQLSAPSGIVATTSADLIVAAGSTSAIVAAQDFNSAAQGNSSHLVAAGISMFTYGKAHDPNKPNQETGIRLHAASGKVSLQSQSGQMKLAARRDVTFAGREVKISASQHALFTAMGAFLRIEGGDITLAALGAIEFKAAQKELAGPGSAQHAPPVMPKGELKGCAMRLAEATDAGGASVRR